MHHMLISISIANLQLLETRRHHSEASALPHSFQNWTLSNEYCFVYMVHLWLCTVSKCFTEFVAHTLPIDIKWRDQTLGLLCSPVIPPSTFTSIARFLSIGTQRHLPLGHLPLKKTWTEQLPNWSSSTVVLKSVPPFRHLVSLWHLDALTDKIYRLLNPSCP